MQGTNGIRKDAIRFDPVSMPEGVEPVLQIRHEICGVLVRWPAHLLPPYPGGALPAGEGRFVGQPILLPPHPMQLRETVNVAKQSLFGYVQQIPEFAE